EKETSNEIAIVTIQKSWATKENFDSLVYVISKNWGIGKNDKNNGILIGICTELRAIRIQNGSGIAERLSDKETKRIIDEKIIPEFKKGNYFKGTKSAILALMQKVR
ncbi:MAG: TPM domain-containing protein, partial [Ginsengibacter sp.]